MPLLQAQARLPELIETAMSGEPVTVELDDGRFVKLTAERRVTRGPFTAEEVQRRRRILEELAASGARHALPGPCAARSQDFLYDDETGLPA